jgi:hypothetical protein
MPFIWKTLDSPHTSMPSSFSSVHLQVAWSVFDGALGGVAAQLEMTTQKGTPPMEESWLWVRDGKCHLLRPMKGLMNIAQCQP